MPIAFYLSVLCNKDTEFSSKQIVISENIVAGYELKNAIGEVEIETSNGIIIVETYQLERFLCMGIVKWDFVVQVYDFLAHGIISDYHGILGLDFLRHHPFCLDIGKGEIRIN